MDPEPQGTIGPALQRQAVVDVARVVVVDRDAALAGEIAALRITRELLLIPCQ